MTDNLNGGISENERLLYMQFRKKINAQAARAQISRLEYDLTDAAIGLHALKDACTEGNALGLGGVCVLPCYVKNCAAYLTPLRKCIIVACISFPLGGDTTDIKVKAVKKAIKDGADEVEVTLPVAYIREGNFAYIKKQLKKLRSACKKKTLRVNPACALLTKEELIKVCRLCADCGVNCINASANGYAAASGLEIFSIIKSAVKDRCTIKAEGVATMLEMSSAQDMGAGIIGSKNASAVARAILAAVEAELP